MSLYADESFYAGEERLGYYVRPMLKRTWAVMLDILAVISDICEKHDIRWYADSGTLLGAVRHGGYIPWDDDVDIAMPRIDYENFIRIAPQELPEGWRLFNGSQDQSPNGLIMRVINTETVNVEPDFLKKYHGCPYIMGVDIFVLDAVPDDPEEDEIFRALLTMAYDVFGKTDNRMTPDECADEVREEIEQLKAALDVEIDRSAPVKRQMAVLADQIAAIYNDTGMQNLSIEPWYINRPEVRIPASCYDDTIMMPFESMMIRVPAGYDKVLRVWYGDDYMTPKQYNPHPALNESERLLRLYYSQRGLEFPKEFE